MERNELRELVDERLSQRQIAERLECSQGNVKYWLDKYGLKTKRKYTPIAKGTILECGSCGRMYEYDRSKGHNRTQCNSCVANAKRREKKMRAVEYLGSKCQCCGYNFYMGALVFHHLDPKEKDFTISDWLCSSWETIEAELNKCALMCHNCHAEHHAGLRFIPPRTT